MKTYEFKNCVTHRSAEIHVDVDRYEGIYFVQYKYMDEPDYNLRGTTEPGTGEKRFSTEAAAIRSAKRYITKEG